MVAVVTSTATGRGTVPARPGTRRGNAAPPANPQRHADGADMQEPTLATTQKVAGITERRDRDGQIRYLVRVRRRGHDYTATFPDWGDALRFRDQAIAAAEGRGPAPPPPTPLTPTPTPTRRLVTVRDAAATLLAGMETGTLRNKRGEAYKPSAFRAYESGLRLYVLPAMAGTPVAALRRGDVQQWVDKVAADHSPDAARKALTALRVVVRVAERYGDELDRDPCRGVTVPTIRKARRRPPRRLTRAEVDALLAAADADDTRRRCSLTGPLVRLLLGTGLRVGEALALTWANVDLERGVVHVVQSIDTKKDDAGARPVLEVKSEDGVRTVPIGAELVGVLRRHRLATGRPDADGFVFADRDGAPFGHTGAPRSSWQRIAGGRRTKKGGTRPPGTAGLSAPYPTLGDLRHAYATLQLARGATPHEVAELLGHSDAGLVNERYGHALPERIASAGDALEAYMRDGDGGTL